MPSNLVKTAHDEKMWEKAKARVASEYPHIHPKDDRYYKILVSIYQNMRGK